MFEEYKGRIVLENNEPKLHYEDPDEQKTTHAKQEHKRTKQPKSGAKLATKDLAVAGEKE